MIMLTGSAKVTRKFRNLGSLMTSSGLYFRAAYVFLSHVTKDELQ
jgi:hypothetical protein